MLVLYPPYYWAELDSKILLLRAWAESRGIATAEIIRRDTMSLADLDRAIDAHPEAQLLVYFHGWWGAEFSSQQLYFYRGLATRTKRRRPHLRIAAIGDYPMYTPDVYLEAMPDCDIAIRTDGYLPVSDFFERAEEGRALEKMRGSVFRAGGQFVHTEQAPTLTSGIKGAELDILPSPYLTGLATRENYGAHYHSMFGCPYLCGYCRTSVFEGKAMRYFSVDRVIEDLYAIKEILGGGVALGPGLGATTRFAPSAGLAGDTENSKVHVSFEDQTFTVDRERTRVLLRRMIDEKVDMTFNCYTRAHLVDEDLLTLMREAGMTAVQFGFESAVPKVLRAAGRLGVNKGETANVPAATASDLPLDPSDLSFKSERAYIQRVTDAVHIAQGLGVTVFVSAIAGLPGSNLEADQETIDYLVRVMKPNHPNINPFMLHPGVRFFEIRKDDYEEKLAAHLFEVPAMSYDLEQLDFRGVMMAPTHLTPLIDQIVGMLDGRAVEASERPVILFTDEPGAPAGLDEVISSGCWQVAIRPNADFLRDREAVAPYPYLDLYDTGERVGPRNWRFQIKRQDNRLRDIVTADGDLDAARFQPGHSLKIWPREDGACRLTLEGDEDVAAYVRLSEATARRRTIRLGRSMLNTLLVFEDACRWAPKECPAPKLQRLSLREGHLAPCPTGGTLVPLGASLAELRGSIAGVQAAAEARRGCATCSVRDACARCPLTGPVSEASYCELQVARARTGWFDFRFINAAREAVAAFFVMVPGDGDCDLWLTSASGVARGPGLPGFLRKSTGIDGIARKAKGYFLLRHPGQDWHLAMRDRTVRVDPEHATTLGLMLDGWDRETVHQGIAREHPGAAPSDLFESATDLLKQFSS